MNEAGEIGEWVVTAEDVTERKTAEEQLRRSHDTFYHLIQNNPFGVYVIDAEFRLRQVSAGAQKVFSEVPPPLLGQDFAVVLRHLWAEPFASEAIGRFRRTLDTGEPYVAVRTVERRQDVDAVEAYDWRIERITLPDGRLGVVCYFYDLSERQRWEAALWESEQRFRLMADAVPQIVWITDAEGRVQFFNEQWSKYTGLGYLPATADEVAATVIHPEDGPATKAAFDAALRSGETFAVEHRIRSASGEYRWFLVRGVPYRDEQTGQITQWFGASVDIHDRRRAEESVRASEDRYRRLVETAHEGIWTIDEAGRTTYINRRMAELLGYPPDEMIGRVHTDFMWEEDRPRGDIDLELRRQGTSQVWDQRYRRKDGKELWTVASCTTLEDANGKFVGALGMFTDITDRKRVEADRQSLLDGERAARSEAERAGRLKDEFLTTLSHELRTPLNAILGWSQILAQGRNVSEDVADGLRTIERNARAQAQIIDDLLDMSRIISGKVRLDVQPVDLATILREAVETIKPSADAKDIRLTAVLDQSAPPMSGDPSRLQQVYWNLLTNAVKFTPRNGRVQVLLERVRSHVEVRVTDTGEGIRPEFLSHVFDRFRQADASTTRRHGGLGLGLSIVKQLVELHGGSIRAESAGVGQGSTFTTSMPLAAVRQGPQPELEPKNSLEDIKAPLPLPIRCPDIAGVKVLVVDDEPDARALVKRFLEDCDAVVHTAGSASDALKSLETEVPDVIVSDIGMPGEDGYAFIRRVRALNASRGGSIPAIALTAYARVEDKDKAIRSGFQIHVPKPVEPVELFTAIASAAGRSQH